MKKIVIAIHGEIGAGKDTVGILLAEQLNNYIPVENKRFAQTVKENISNMIGIPLTLIEGLPYANDVYDFTREQKEMWLDDWGYSIGRALQIYATEAVRDNLHNDAWILSLRSKLSKSAINIITDLRFENELFWLDSIDAIKIKVVRNNPEIKGSRDSSHLSEKGLSDDVFDYVIDNNGSMMRLAEQVLLISKEIKKKLKVSEKSRG